MSGGSSVIFLLFDELQRELRALEVGSFNSLADAELCEKIRLVHTGFNFRVPTFPAGTQIYRAVKVSERPSRKARISYPPIGMVTSNGRLNRPGEGMFNGSFNQFASCLLECSAKVGELFAISAWLTTQVMSFNHLGYSTTVLEVMKSNRNVPFFAEVHNGSERNRFIREWQARVFTQRVPAGQEHKYRLSIALKDFALEKFAQIGPNFPSAFSGITYPSVAMWLLCDNVAILPEEVDAKMSLFEVIFLTLDSITETRKDDGSIVTNYAMRPCDFARPDGDGNLVWGQRSQVIHPPGTDASKFTPRLLPPE
jgi:hypothetical protein